LDGVSGVSETEDLFAIGASVAVEFCFRLNNGADHAGSGATATAGHDYGNWEDKDEVEEKLQKRTRTVVCPVFAVGSSDGKVSIKVSDDQPVVWG